MADSTQKVLNIYTATIGADPELFAENSKGQIVGSELVIPEKLAGSHGSVVRDGVQLEIHLNPAGCRQGFGSNIVSAFTALRTHLAKQQEDPKKITFRSVVKMLPSQMKLLSPESRLLGCAPSLNAYDENATIKVNPVTYRMRSAGGHIHLGADHLMKNHARELIKVMDVLCGNISVMIDREPLMRIRRRVYGRAGEYRIQPHGVEYRTLSNFWLKGFPLMSGMMAQARQALNVVATTHKMHFYDSKMEPWNAYEALFSYVNEADIRRAIDKNDLDLAKKNWQGTRKFIHNHIQRGANGINPSNILQFEYFIQMIDEYGLDYWFPTNPMEHWTQSNLYQYGQGWETFLGNKVLQNQTNKQVRPVIQNAQV